ncbi:MAG: MATE family efflux transporter [Candidatus Bipolaricaulota bacterium]
MSRTCAGSVILMGLISRLEVVAATACGIGRRIIRILNIAIWGLASPLTTMVGQNIGSEQEDRADLEGTDHRGERNRGLLPPPT